MGRHLEEHMNSPSIVMYVIFNEGKSSDVFCQSLPTFSKLNLQSSLESGIAIILLQLLVLH